MKVVLNHVLYFISLYSWYMGHEDIRSDITSIMQMLHNHQDMKLLC